MSGGHSIAGIFRLVARLTFALVFLWSGISKWIDPEGFALAVYRYHLLPGELVNLVALWIPTLEILCAALLFVPKFRFPALGILVVLLAVFSLAIVISILSGNTMACGCFSTSAAAGAMDWTGLLRNLALFVIVLISVRDEFRALF
ncbi:MauE/DoxX family redox-associated membrane protein [Pontiella sp.]|uniref:MauE/DoxX family redox-associated membrane protein n=1 Tax=Pontiella sp. TaxID=2837462 RepID=UPI0035626269